VLIPEDIETPALVVDRARLLSNIEGMARGANGIALRPHVKTHKCGQIARLQLEHGAVGLAVATLAEAEAFTDADADLRSVFIAYPLWAGAAGRRERIARLRERVDLRMGLDSVALAEQLPAGQQVMIELDSGQHRSGVQPRQVRALTAECLRLGLDVLGAFTHPGHAYDDPGNPPKAAADERAALAEAGEAIEGLTGRAPELSGGSTPTAYDGVTAPLTEVRPGTYVFGDRQQMRLAGRTADEVALVVAARVVSTPRPGEAVLDSGSKALSKDRPGWLEGHGLIPEAPDAVIDTLSDEHAVVRDLRANVGDLVQVIPNHVCPVVNLARELVITDNGEITDIWPLVGTRR
jgi:D-serine deaminase-like pyridoxal phosphate-dependent protein